MCQFTIKSRETLKHDSSLYIKNTKQEIDLAWNKNYFYERKIMTIITILIYSRNQFFKMHISRHYSFYWINEFFCKRLDHMLQFTLFIMQEIYLTTIVIYSKSNTQQLLFPFWILYCVVTENVDHLHGRLPDLAGLFLPNPLPFKPHLLRISQLWTSKFKMLVLPFL